MKSYASLNPGLKTSFWTLVLAMFLGMQSQMASAFDGYINIRNNTGYDIYSAYVSPDSSGDWGESVLGDEVLEDGEEFHVELNDYDSSVFHIKLVDQDGDVYLFMGVDVLFEDIVANIGHMDASLNEGAATDNFDGYINVTNSTGYTIYYLYLSHEDSDTWEEDALGSEVLSDGDSFRVDLNDYPSSIFNVRAQDEDGDTYTVYSIDVATQDLTLTLAQMDDATDDDFSGYIEVTNRTGYDIYYLYVSHSDSDSWGEDALGNDILRDGDSFRVDLDGYPSSYFDVKAEDEDEDTYTKFEIDVSIDDLTLTLSDLD